MKSKLSNIIQYSAQNVEYYRNLQFSPKSNIKDIPLLTKSELQDKTRLLINDRDSYNIDKLLAKSSSGSSGIPTTVYWSQDGYMQSMRSLWKRRVKFHNIKPYSIELDFTNNTLDAINWYSLRKNGISVSRLIIDDEEKLEKLFYYINNIEVEWIYIQPYVTAKLMSFIKNNNVKIPKSLRYIEFVGEILSNEIRQSASELFKVPVANMYGSEEMNGIAYECPYGNLHILNDNVFVETEYENEGEIIITNLNNYTMPLLRYRQGDVIELLPENKCACGQEGRIIRSILGRSYEVINLNKCKINPYILISIMEHVNSQIGGYINQYKFVWYSKTEKIYLYIKCSLKNFNKEKMISIIIKQLDNIYLKINWKNIIFVKEIPKEFGKYSILKIIENEVTDY